MGQPTSDVKSLTMLAVRMDLNVHDASILIHQMNCIGKHHRWFSEVLLKISFDGSSSIRRRLSKCD
jgi:hypothetical protein